MNGINGYIPEIRSKAEAMKYAFDITTVFDTSSNEVKINKEQALEVYYAFVDNINLPDVHESNQLKEVIEKYADTMKYVSERDKTGNDK